MKGLNTLMLVPRMGDVSYVGGYEDSIRATVMLEGEIKELSFDGMITANLEFSPNPYIRARTVSADAPMALSVRAATWAPARLGVSIGSPHA